MTFIIPENFIRTRKLHIKTGILLAVALLTPIPYILGFSFYEQTFEGFIPGLLFALLLVTASWFLLFTPISYDTFRARKQLLWLQNQKLEAAYGVHREADLADLLMLNGAATTSTHELTFNKDTNTLLVTEKD